MRAERLHAEAGGYSPNGRRLAFSGYGPDASLWMVDFDERGAASGPPVRLLVDHRWPQPVSISWMPDSRTLSLSHYHPTEATGLWLLDVERRLLTKITAGVERLRQQQISADGRIAVVAGAPDVDLVSIPLEGGTVTDLLATSRYEHGAVLGPSKAADEIAYVTNKGGVDEIRLRRTSDGTERVIVGTRSFRRGRRPSCGPVDFARRRAHAVQPLRRTSRPRLRGAAQRWCPGPRRDR
jgi:hypothetical protein